MRVLHRNRRRCGEHLPQLHGGRVERVPGVVVDVQRPDHPVGRAQRQRQHAVHPEAGDPPSELGPPRVVGQRPRHHRHALGDRSDAGPLPEAVLHRVDLTDKVDARHDGVRPVLLEQGQPHALGARDGADRVLRHPGQQLLQRHPPRGQPRQARQAGREVVVLARRRALRSGTLRRVRVGHPCHHLVELGLLP